MSKIDNVTINEAVGKLEKLHTEMIQALRDRDSHLSINYRDGRCDGVDLAITELEKMKVKS